MFARLRTAAILCLCFTAATRGDEKLNEQVRTIFTDRCAFCHPGGGEERLDWFDLTDAQQLANPPKNLKVQPIIVPGDPDKSLLWKKVRDQSDPRRMPKLPSEPLTDAQLAAIKKWIESGAGAAAKAEPKRRDFISLETMLQSMMTYLDKLDPDDWPYQRFFTITHLHNNNPKIHPDRYLALTRAALVKTINSLTWKPRVVIPTAVDKHETVFAIDLRDLDWDQANYWRLIEKGYPYGLDHAEGKGEIGRLGRKYNSYFNVKGDPIFFPYIRADWFVAEATRPPLYHVLLNIPQSAPELEARLKVSVYDNFRRNRLYRAAFERSGVSAQNRLIERHDSIFGAYWKSYDFKRDNDFGQLKDLPLGPKFSQGHKWSGREFVQDGGEIIFHLPNGLQGYMLVGPDDRRIDFGPPEVVRDLNEVSGDTTIHTGVSCMSCHQHGMFPSPADEVRRDTSVLGGLKTKVERLYPENDRMQALIKEDEERFLKALEKVVAPYLKAAYPEATTIKDYPEPIGQISKSYRIGPLNPDTVAAEVFCQDKTALVSQLGTSGLRELGLGAVANDRIISRRTWEKRAADLSSRLELGMPRTLR